MDINYLLLIVAIFLLACAIHGYRKGFLRIAITLVGLVVIMMVVTNISPYVSNFVINKTPVYENVKNKMVDAFSDYNNENNNGLADQENTIKSYGLPELIAGALIENNTDEKYDELAVTVFEDYIAGYLSRIVINAGTFIVLVAVLWAVFYILLFTANILDRIPVLRTLNRVLGLGCNLLIGLIVVWLMFLVGITFLGDELAKNMIAYVRESQLLTYLFNSNPLFQFIK